MTPHRSDFGSPTVSTTKATASASGTCSHSRITVQPAWTRATSAARSRSTFLASLGDQYHSLLFGLEPCSGQACQKHPSMNTATLLRSRKPFVHRADDDTLHWVIGDVVPPELRAALETDEESLMRERERLWYVACTRARELLIVPQLGQAEQKSWARVVNLGHDVLPELDVSRMTPAPMPEPFPAPTLEPTPATEPSTDEPTLES